MPQLAPLVVVIEPDRLNRQLFVQVLQQNNVPVRAAPNADMGLSLLQEATPTAIFLEMYQPEMSAFELVQTIRSTPALAGCKVVALTGLTLPEEQERWQKFCDYYLPKPVSAAKLTAVAQALLQGRRPEL